MLFRVLGVLHQRHLSRSTHQLKKSMSQRCCWEWEKCIPPPPGPVAELKLNNSFTRKKDLFKPLQDRVIDILLVFYVSAFLDNILNIFKKCS